MDAFGEGELAGRRFTGVKGVLVLVVYVRVPAAAAPREWLNPPLVLTSNKDTGEGPRCDHQSLPELALIRLVQHYVDIRSPWRTEQASVIHRRLPFKDNRFGGDAFIFEELEVEVDLAVAAAAEAEVEHRGVCEQRFHGGKHVVRRVGKTLRRVCKVAGNGVVTWPELADWRRG